MNIDSRTFFFRLSDNIKIYYLHELLVNVLYIISYLGGAFFSPVLV